MKILHLGDIHLGKKLNEFSLLEEQKYFTKQVYDLVRERGIETVVIAGDIYDRSIPSEESVKLFDEFIHELVNLKCKIVAVTGNHDSGIRLNFAHNILANQGVYIYGELKSQCRVVTIDDVDFFLFPFATPSEIKSQLRDILSDEELNEIKSFDSAMKVILERAKPEIERSKNFKFGVYHGFVVGSSKDKEDTDMINSDEINSDEVNSDYIKEDSVRNISIGGKESVSSKYFDDFNYTALGHLHSCRKAGKNVMYSGSPIRYSFSEVNHTKYFVVIDTSKDGSYNLEKVEIKHIYPMEKFVGTIEELLETQFEKETLLKVVLTESTLDALSRIRVKYPNILELSFDIKRVGVESRASEKHVSELTYLELFNEFALWNGEALNNDEISEIERLIEEVEVNRSENR